MVFQSYALFPNMTVWDNVAFGLKMKPQPGGISPPACRGAGAGGGPDRFRAPLSAEFSGGQRASGAARLLVVQPRIPLAG